MKKVLAALLVGLISLTLSGVAGAAPATPDVDFAKGRGTDSFGGQAIGAFNFSATDSDGLPATDDATGAFSYHAKGRFSGNPSLKGTVTCLRVEGSLAVVGGTVDNTDDPTFEGGSFYLGVSDSGLPKGEGDEFLLRLDPGFPNASCGLYPPGTGGGRPILKGDILVIDATPPA